MNKCFILILTVFFNFSICAKPISDSLTLETNLSELIKTCYENPDSAYSKITQLEDSIKNLSVYFYAKTLNTKGIYFDITNQWDSALIYYRKSLNNCKNYSFYNLHGAIYNNIGLINWNKQENDSAIFYFLRALSLFEKTNNKVFIANVYSNLALIYNDQQEPEKAIKYQKKSLKLYLELNQPRNIAIAYTNLGNFYLQLKNDSAEYFIRKSIEIKKKIKDNYGLGISYNDLAAYFINKEKYDSAEVYLSISNNLMIPMNNYKIIASNYASLGWVYYKMGLLNKAEKALYECLNIAEKHQLPYKILMAYERLAILYEKKQDFKHASEYYNKAYHLNANIFDREKDKQIAELEKKYQYEKQRKEIVEKEQIITQQQYQNQIKNLWIIITLLLLTSLIFLFFYIYKRNKLEKQKIEQENQLKLANEKQKKEQALQQQSESISRELHDNIGAHLTYISTSLDHIQYTLTSNKTLKKEIKSISDFTKETMNELRETVKTLHSKELNFEEFSKKINNLTSKLKQISPEINYILKINNTSSNLSAFQGINLYRIIQETLNNIIKHAQATLVNIEIVGDENKFHIKISDNGKGFDTSDNTLGNGLINMKKRAENIHAKLTVNSEINKGTTIEVIMNLR
jgi:signal transduction histidine kinase